MPLNLRKIEERIQKLQEIKRIAADPEMVAMLLEFMATEDEQTQPASAERMEPASAPKDDGVAASHSEDVDLVNHILKGMDGPGSSLWSRKRAPNTAPARS